MSHGTEHHLEEAEHAQHALHDPFARRVAMTMAVVAATLACVTLASHRAHNETLNQQLISSKHAAEAHNQWGRYQAKVIRSYGYEAWVKQLPLLAKDPKGERVEEKTQERIEEMEHKLAEWKKETGEIAGEAQRETEKAEKAAQASEHAHHQSLFFDGGELAVELALVLCSVAMLARRRAFWYTGIAIWAIGLAVGLVGLFAQPEPPSSHEHSALNPPRQAASWLEHAGVGAQPGKS